MPLLTSSLLSTIVLASQSNKVQSVSNQLNQSQIHAWHFENEPLPLYIRNTSSVKSFKNTYSQTQTVISQ
ncbi:hypothetical protein P4S63_26240 [Pseudoalteromonas sp. B193]